MPNGKPKARHTKRFPRATENQSKKVQARLIANCRTLDSTLKAVASCSSVLKTARFILAAIRPRSPILESSQSITLFERRLNQINSTIPAASKMTRTKPAARVRLRSSAEPVAGFSHSKLRAKIETTVIVSYKRSIMIVTNDAAGRTRLSRIGSTTGLTISPARPINKTAPNPTVVATHTSRRLALVRGVRKACQRIARQR